MDAEQVREARAALTALLAEIDTGQVEADSTERAYLAGALDVVIRLDRPVTADEGRSNPGCTAAVRW